MQTSALEIDGISAGISADLSVTDVAGIEISVVDVRVIDGIEIYRNSADVCMPHGAENQGSSDVQIDNVTDDFNDNVDDLKDK